MRSPTVFVLSAAIVLAFCSSAFSQETETQLAKSPLVFAIDADDSTDVFIEQLRESAQQVAEEKGYMPEEIEGPADMQASVKERGSAAGAMITVSKTESGLEAKVAVHFGGMGEEQKRQVTHASAAAQVRAMMRSMLPMASLQTAEEATEVVAQAPLAAAEEESSTESDFVGIAAPVEAPGPTLDTSPDQSRTVGTAPPRPSNAELSSIPQGRVIARPPREIGRSARVFGATAGMQGGAWGIAAIGYSMFYVAESDYDTGDYYDDVIIISGIYYALSPPLSSLLGYKVGNKSLFYESSYGSVVAGAYLGALGGFGVTFASAKIKDPTMNLIGAFFAPILLPAFGAAIGYASGKTRKEGVIKLGFNRQGEPALAIGKNASWSLPKPVVMKSMDGSRGAHMGVSFGKLTF